jgi:hypothetical protein
VGAQIADGVPWRELPRHHPAPKLRFHGLCRFRFVRDKPKTCGKQRST